MQPAGLSAQELPESLIQMIEERVEDGGGDMESLLSYYEHLLEHPVDINKATSQELEYLGLLSPFQAASVVDYRNEYGEILSFSELQLVDGFNGAVLRRISPFITFYPSRPVASLPRRRVHNELRLRGRRRIPQPGDLGIPYYLSARYRFRYGSHLTAGLTLENDAGEPVYPDFLSAHLAVKQLKWGRNFEVKSLVLGDFSARFGQGLVLWNSFSLSATGSPSSVFRKETPIVPYLSTDESSFFRGMGVTLDFGPRWRLSLLASRKKVDARLDGGRYTALPRDGLHNTVSKLETRRKMGETLYGAHLSWRRERWKLGMTGAVYAFDRKNGIRPRRDNRYQQYDGWWGNFSLDASLLLGRRWRAFAELAVDRKAHPAALLGLIYTPGAAAEYSLLYRHYPKDYIAAHAGAYSSTSRCANEYGLLFNGAWGRGGSLNFAFSGDFVYYPWLRYGVDRPYFAVKSRGHVEWAIDERRTGALRLAFRYKGAGQLYQGGLRLHYAASLGERFSLRARIETNGSLSEEKKFSAGALAYVEGIYSREEKGLSVALRSTLFHVDRWEDRIYCYERDLPRSFAVPAMYGRGLSFYVNLKYRPCRWLGLYFKASYSDFLNKAENLFRLKLELSWTF